MSTSTLSRRGLFHRLAGLVAGWLCAGRASAQQPSAPAVSLAASSLPPGLEIDPGTAIPCTVLVTASDGICVRTDH